ncbi:hypothetical protein JCM3766R1_006041, partial [Sporobolomyces carnicolor]
DFVPVVDIASLHVAALLLPSVKHERLFASAYTRTWNDILAIFRAKYLTKSFHDDIADPHTTYPIFDTAASLDALKQLGQDGWTPLERALEDNVAPFA